MCVCVCVCVGEGGAMDYGSICIGSGKLVLGYSHPATVELHLMCVCAFMCVVPVFKHPLSFTLSLT